MRIVRTTFLPTWKKCQKDINTNRAEKMPAIYAFPAKRRWHPSLRELATGPSHAFNQAGPFERAETLGRASKT